MLVSPILVINSKIKRYKKWDIPWISCDSLHAWLYTQSHRFTCSCGFGCCPFQGCGPVVVGSLFIVAPTVCGIFVFDPCFVVQYLVSVLVLQSSWWVRESKLFSRSLVAVGILWFFLTVSWFGQCMIVLFPGDTRLYFDMYVPFVPKQHCPSGGLHILED